MKEEGIDAVDHTVKLKTITEVKKEILFCTCNSVSDCKSFRDQTGDSIIEIGGYSGLLDEYVIVPHNSVVDLEYYLNSIGGYLIEPETPMIKPRPYTMFIDDWDIYTKL